MRKRRGSKDWRLPKGLGIGDDISEGLGIGDDISEGLGIRDDISEGLGIGDDISEGRGSKVSGARAMATRFRGS